MLPTKPRGLCVMFAMIVHPLLCWRLLETCSVWFRENDVDQLFLKILFLHLDEWNAQIGNCDKLLIFKRFSLKQRDELRPSPTTSNRPTACWRSPKLLARWPKALYPDGLMGGAQDQGNLDRQSKVGRWHGKSFWDVKREWRLKVYRGAKTWSNQKCAHVGVHKPTKRKDYIYICIYI